MVSLGNYFQVINLKFTVFLKIFSFIFLIWTYITYKDMDIFPKTLENKNEHGNISNMHIHRLLAKDDINRKLGNAGTGTKFLHDNIGKSKKNLADDISIRSQLNKKGSNNFDTHMNNYKHRYENKKGLSKLDCYCEKKVFDNISYIEKLSDKLRSDKYGFKKKILKKYGVAFIILTLIPALGLIYYILFGFGKGLRGVFELCWEKPHYNNDSRSHTDAQCTRLNLDEWQTTLENLKITNVIFSFIMITIALLFLFYILTKIIKYEKLKAGKGKMSINEYYRFCKDIF